MRYPQHCSHLCCDITVGSSIVSTASSFSVNLFENPVSNCALFVNESAVKLNEQRTKFLLMRSGSSLKLNFIHSFLMLGSEERQCKHCFSTTWHCTTSCCLQSHLYRLVVVYYLRVCLVNTTRGNRWAGLNRQWCRMDWWGPRGACRISSEGTHSFVFVFCLFVCLFFFGGGGGGGGGGGESRTNASQVLNSIKWV